MEIAIEGVIIIIYIYPTPMKLLARLSIVALFFVSCLKNDLTLDEYTPQQLIFAPQTQTRGTLVASSDQLVDLGVYAIESITTTPSFMCNVKVERNGDEWEYSPTKEWGERDYDELTFYSYAPYAAQENGITPCEESYEGVPYISYTTPQSVVDQPDLMVATYAINSVTGCVTLNFSHTLAAIKFIVPSESSTTQVDSLLLRGVVTSGTLSIDGVSDWLLDDVSEQSSYCVKFGDMEDDQFASLEEYTILAIPQSLTSSASVQLYINGEVRDYTFAADAAWRAGEVYSYEVTADGGAIELSGVENCYIVDPSAAASFNFDAVTRVNQFWGSSDMGGVDSEHLDVVADGAGYIALGSCENVICDDDEWYLELIWADFDAASAISFAQSQSSYGVGHQRATFTLSTSLHGNMLIGLKKVGMESSDDYLWSWHLWLTDYDPENPDTKIYLPLSDDDGFYNNGREIMDRNLGATSSVSGDVGCYGLYYQWGRKDPFYSSGYLYCGDVSSQVEYSESIDTSTKGSFTGCFYYPYIFYYTGFSNPNDPYYSSGESYSEDEYNRWGGCESSTSNTPFENDKTIFDPSPAGWRVPSGGNWSGFTTDNFTTSSSSWGDYSGNAFAPAGSRHYLGDGMYFSGSAGFYWSATPDDPTTILYYLKYIPAHLLTFGSSYLDFDVDMLYYKTSGFSIRPIKLKD